MQELNINRLISGGLMTAYICSSKCRHCLYCSSPGWEKKFINKEMAYRLMEKIKSMGCNEIHIGGGEPFLNIDALLGVLQAAGEVGISINYIETNSSWYINERECLEVLKEIKKYGINTLLISISPFHNEYIPFYKVKNVIKSCKKAGLYVFPWQEQFFDEIDSFNDQETHKLSEYSERYGDSYLKQLSQRFSLTLRGRAMNTYKNIIPKEKTDKIIKNQNNGCRNLANSSHFHFDPYGNYIPGLCSGLSINYQDLGQPLSSKKYKILNILYNQGISGLLNWVQKQYQFQPETEYLSKCHLCHEIRKFLVLETEKSFPELQPVAYYSQV